MQKTTEAYVSPENVNDKYSDKIIRQYKRKL